MDRRTPRSMLKDIVSHGAEDNRPEGIRTDLKL